MMDHEPRQKTDWNAIRERLASAQGKTFWRTLDEVADTDEFQRVLNDEFPDRANLLAQMDRRQFLTLAGASLALAGLSGCRVMPQERAVPAVRAPEEYLPGTALSFATAMPLSGYAHPLLVTSHDGRPTKAEGNDMHQASLGATNIYAQASLITMYDPSRSQNVVRENEISGWDAFQNAVLPIVRSQKEKQGAGIHILTETVTSPTFAAQVAALQKLYPQAQWHSYESVNRDNVYAGANAAFGSPQETLYDLSKAKRIVLLDSDILNPNIIPGTVKYARDYANGRRVDEKDAKELNRLYAIESTPTITGAMADHRLPLKASEIAGFAAMLATALGASLGSTAAEIGDEAKAEAEKFVKAIADDLKQNGGAAVIIPGNHQSPAVHAICHVINASIGAVSNGLVTYRTPIVAGGTTQVASLKNLVSAIDAGNVDVLMILAGNPVYTAPADLKFGEQLSKVPLSVHLSLYEDETSAKCKWHLPETHFLESWGDALAYDGTPSIVQPLIKPLYDNCRSALELLSLFLELPVPTQLDVNGNPKDYDAGYELVKAHWMTTALTNGAAASQTTMLRLSQAGWDKALNDGFITLPTTTNALQVVPALKTNPLEGLEAAPAEEGNGGAPPGGGGGFGGGGFPGGGAPPGGGGQGGGGGERFEINFRPDPTVHDGFWANNPWLQELPKPFTSITWDNAILISPRMAQRLNIGTEDVVKLTFNGVSIEAPVVVNFGHPDHSVTVHLGYGRTRGGEVLKGTGFNFGLMRHSDAMDFADGATLQPVGGQYSLAMTEEHHFIDAGNAKDPNDDTVDGTQGRDLVRIMGIEEYRKNAAKPFELEGEHGPERGDGGRLRAGKRYADVSLFPETVGGADDELARGIYSMAQKEDQSWDYSEDYKWGMAIDLNVCIGCNVCTIACQSENNIATVGKAEVKRRREMHWIRIDRYQRGDIDNPETYFMPIPCMHCEKAPCEPVCPVAATVHSHDGLNMMVYNRCIGTKYCSNNCPYKVRRFNFLNYANDFTYPVVMLSKNPNVTVRGRGVMEKCTFCTQRISEKRIEAKKQGRRMGGDEVVTACQAACPTGAIVFGDMNDTKSQVAKFKQQSHNYALLEELQTQPRTTYLARFRNPNPALESAVERETSAAKEG